MKYVTLVLALLAMMTSNAKTKDFAWGAKAGLYAANTTQVPYGWADASFKNGFAGGIFLNYAFNDNISLQPEVLYVMKGPEGSIVNRYWHTRFTAHYDYLQIPLLLTITMPLNSALRLHVFAGPSLAINISADVDITAEQRITDETQTGSLDHSKIMNSVEPCITFGAGFGYLVGPGKITFEGRLDVGVSKIYKDGEVTGELNGAPVAFSTQAGDSKNIGAALLVGYGF